jgi:hypothetical protein
LFISSKFISSTKIVCKLIIRFLKGGGRIHPPSQFFKMLLIMSIKIDRLLINVHHGPLKKQKTFWVPPLISFRVLNLESVKKNWGKTFLSGFST